MERKCGLSIVVPLYNEKENLKYLSEKIKRTVEAMGRTYEVLFVDDGSSDGSNTELEEIIKNEKNVKMITLRRNFGKSIALATGFRHASGDVVITMDADLQDDADEIPRFVNKIEEGWDIVSGWKRVRRDNLEKKLASKIFNMVVSRISGLRLHDFNCGYKAYRKDVLTQVRLYGELHRFIPMIAFSYGYRICEIEVKHHKRRYGRSKYGRGRYISGVLDLMTAVFISQYLRRPLHLLGKISMMSFMMGFLLMLYVGFMKFVMGQTGDRPALIISVFFLGLSAQIMLFGLLADFLSHINQRVNFVDRDYVKERSR